jgi:hypothetical protein
MKETSVASSAPKSNRALRELVWASGPVRVVPGGVVSTRDVAVAGVSSNSTVLLCGTARPARTLSV